MAQSIAIISNEFNCKIEDSRYFLARLLKFWKQQGIKIHITAGPNYKPADVALLHVDTTVVADEYFDLSSRYPVVLNESVKDILKTTISRYLLKRNDSYQGPVIVKTNENYGGVNEFINAVKTGQSAWYDPEVERPWRKRVIMDSLKYPVFENLSTVPPGVWKNDKLIVEKFLPERLDNGDYRCRTYYFFGEQEFGAWMTSPKPVIKSSVANAVGLLDEIPQALRDIRNASGFNYGKFDYTEIDGEVYVYDMNKTPASSPRLIELFSNGKWEDFANEIHKFG